MPSPDTEKVRCNTCGTTFSPSDPVESGNHEGHDLVHVDPGG